MINIFYFFNKNIKYLRNKRKLSQTELANQLNLTKSYIQKIELGQRNTTFETLHIIKSFFNISIDDLFYNNLEEQDKQESK